jgi:hypothetical protein
MRAQGIAHAVECDARRNLPLVQARVHQLDMIGDIALEGIQPGDIGFVIGRRVQRDKERQLWEGEMKAACL